MDEKSVETLSSKIWFLSVHFSPKQFVDFSQFNTPVAGSDSLTISSMYLPSG